MDENRLLTVLTDENKASPNIISQYTPRIRLFQCFFAPEFGEQSLFLL